MSDSNAAAKSTTATSDKKPDRPVNPDRVGEEVADDATIWQVYDRIAREDDERRTKSWDNGLNNLALFAGLFSAVTTAFIIEAQQDMEPDYAQLTFLVLNATAAGDRFVARPFVIPPGTRTVNCLWIASLILSLSAALIAIMGKDWIGMYTARPVCNLRQWAEMRTYRLRCVERWYMSGVIAAAPVLLHLSLILFGAGLVIFISEDPFTHHLTLWLCLAAGVLYLATALSATVFAASPFKSPATQMIRAAIAALFGAIRNIFARPKRNLLPTVLGAINAIVVPGAADLSLTSSSPLLPGVHQQQHRRSLVDMLSVSGQVLLASVAAIRAPLRAAAGNLRWSSAKPRLDELVATALSLPIGEWFTSSTWTDLPADRRLELIADSLSWLNSASQAPDVLRALIFALGDLEIGGRVAPLLSSELRGRFDSELRHTLHRSDFLTLSRYALASSNLCRDLPSGFWSRFLSFDPEEDRSLCCEDGIAVAVVQELDAYRMAVNCPEHVAQSRMMEFLLPFVADVEVVIHLANAYRGYLWEYKPVNVFQLEVEIQRRLDSTELDDYAAAATDLYGSRTGALELITFLCQRGKMFQKTKTAAAELVMHIVEILELTSREKHDHPCLALLFGDSGLRRAVWTDTEWSTFQIACLCSMLRQSILAIDQYSTTPESDSQFRLALAGTTVMMLSPQYVPFHGEHLCVAHLSAQISHTRGRLSNESKLKVIRLSLEVSVLLKILNMPDEDADADEDGDAIAGHGTAILATITHFISLLLHNANTFIEGRQLFQLLAFSKAKRIKNPTASWDLGAWLGHEAPKWVQIFPSSRAPMADFHDAMAAIYPFCTTDSELRALWGRIGYPGQPRDIFSDPFLDLGAFFNNAEAPCARPGHTSHTSSLNPAGSAGVVELRPSDEHAQSSGDGSQD